MRKKPLLKKNAPKYERAYIFFAEAETTQRLFSDEDIRKATTYTSGSIKNYQSKIWKWFLCPQPGNQWKCSGLLSEPREEFYKLHSQVRTPPTARIVVKEVPVHIPVVIDSRAWLVLAIVVVVRLRGRLWKWVKRRFQRE